MLWYSVRYVAAYKLTFGIRLLMLIQCSIYSYRLLPRTM